MLFCWWCWLSGQNGSPGSDEPRTWDGTFGTYLPRLPVGTVFGIWITNVFSACILVMSIGILALSFWYRLTKAVLWHFFWYMMSVIVLNSAFGPRSPGLSVFPSSQRVPDLPTAAISSVGWYYRQDSLAKTASRWSMQPCSWTALTSQYVVHGGIGRPRSVDLDSDTLTFGRVELWKLAALLVFTNQGLQRFDVKSN